MIGELHCSCVWSVTSLKRIYQFVQWPIGRKLRICSHKWIEINDIKYESASMYISTLWLSFQGFCSCFLLRFSQLQQRSEVQSEHHRSRGGYFYTCNRSNRYYHAFNIDTMNGLKKKSHCLSAINRILKVQLQGTIPNGGF